MTTTLDLLHIPQHQTASRVVVPLDFSSASRRALAVGAQLAVSFGLGLELVNVRPAGADTADMAQQSGRLAELVPHLLAGYGALAEVSYRVLNGDEVAQTLADADRSAIVVIGSDSVRRRQTLRGSVAEGVVRAAHRQPVVIVGPAVKNDGRDGPVAVMLDGSPLAEAALAPAVAWARAFHRPLALVQVVSASAAAYARRDAGGRSSPYLLDVQRALEPEHVASSAHLIEHGDASAAIVDHLARLSCSYAFAATHASTGVEREAFGSTAMAVALKSPCPTCVVRPRLAAGRALR